MIGLLGKIRIYHHKFCIFPLSPISPPPSYRPSRPMLKSLKVSAAAARATSRFAAVLPQQTVSAAKAVSMDALFAESVYALPDICALPPVAAPVVAAPLPAFVDPLAIAMPTEAPLGLVPGIVDALELMNRNKRKLKKANHGARPCNSRGRKARRIRRHWYSK